MGLAWLADRPGRFALVVSPGLDHDVVTVLRPQVTKHEQAVLASGLRLERAAGGHHRLTVLSGRIQRIHQSETLAPAIRPPAPAVTRPRSLTAYFGSTVSVTLPSLGRAKMAPLVVASPERALSATASSGSSRSR